jgi:simple sugar transport system ATP-binding protein
MTTDDHARAGAAPPILRMRGIVKRFGTLLALDAVDLDIRGGEIHALLGENGAGKSTLMNCLFGLVTPDGGEILVDGAPVRMTSPRRAQELGIGMVHQHFKLAPSLTVAENVFLGNEPRAGPFLRPREAVAKVAALSAAYGLGVDPADRVGSLPVGVQQRVEILRALARQARVLVLDEPTAVLTPHETERFFAVVKGFAAQGLAVVLISHHLEEVRRLADRVTVLRRGRKVAHAPIAALTNADLASLITGQERPVTSAVAMGVPGAVRLAVRGLSVRSSRGKDVVHGVDLAVHAGEIVGVLGVAGNGQTELVEAITGLRRPGAGSVVVNGTETAGHGPGAARRAGLSHIPEDRNGRGLAGYWSVADNIAAGHFDGGALGRLFLAPARISSLVAGLMLRFDIRAQSQRQLAHRLSGGNAQKTVLARELSRQPDVIVCAEPTRGLDIAASAFVRGELVARRDAGAAVLLVASDIEEVTGIADRVLVMSSGRIVARYAGRRPSEAEVGRAMLGGDA